MCSLPIKINQNSAPTGCEFHGLHKSCISEEFACLFCIIYSFSATHGERMLFTALKPNWVILKILISKLSSTGVKKTNPEILSRFSCVYSRTTNEFFKTRSQGKCITTSMDKVCTLSLSPPYLFQKNKQTNSSF